MPFLNTAAFRMHYETQGHGGTPILLLHGNFASWRWWKPFLQKLPDRYTAYAPDFRGCGDSGSPEHGFTVEQLALDVIELADHLDLTSFHLVGHSLGGAVAQEICGQHPERVASLTLVAPAPADGMELLEGKKPTSLINMLSAETTFSLVNKLGIQRSSFHSSFKRILPGVTPEGFEFEQLVNDALRVEQPTFDGFLNSLREWRGVRYLKKYSCPVMIVCGHKDQVVPPESLVFMHDRIPDCRFACWKDVGHAPQLEQVEAFNSLLILFIEGKVRPEDLPDKSLASSGNFLSSAVSKIRDGISYISNKFN